MDDVGPQRYRSPQQAVFDALTRSSVSPKAFTESDSWPYLQRIQAYPDQSVYEPDQNVKVFYSRDMLGAGQFVKSIQVQDALSGSTVWTKTYAPGELPLELEPCESFYGRGCNLSRFVEIPARTLPKGAFYANLVSDLGEESQDLFFVVRGDTAAITVMVPDFTWQAYNFAGGGSFYGFHRPRARSVTTTQRLLEVGFASKTLREKLLGLFWVPGPGYDLWYLEQDKFMRVSVQRPYYFSVETDTNFFHGPGPTVEVLRELAKERHDYEIISNSYLHAHTESLRGKKLLILAGHDEYWTKEMRGAVDDFLRVGGHVANFSGNLAYFKTNYVDGNLYVNKDIGRSRTEEGNRLAKEARYDGVGYYSKAPNNRGAEQSFCLGFFMGGYSVSDNVSPLRAFSEFGLDANAYEDSKGAKVLDPDHPVFAGTGLKEGDLWGKQSNLIAEELDGVALLPEDVMNPASMSPKSTHVLATTYVYMPSTYEFDDTDVLAMNGIRKVGIFAECQPFADGGTVVNFGSMGYAKSMKNGDPHSLAVFRNTVRYLLGK